MTPISSPIDTINAKGGVTVGGQKYKLALNLLDNQSDVNLERQPICAARRRATRSTSCSARSPATSRSTTARSPRNIKFRWCRAAAPRRQIYSRGYKYIFGTLPPADDYFASTIEHAGQARSQGADRGAAGGRRQLRRLRRQGHARAARRNAGMKLVVDEKYRENASDFSSMLTRGQGARARRDLLGEP